MKDDNDFSFTLRELPKSKMMNLSELLGIRPNHTASLESHPIEVQIHDGHAYIWVTQLFEANSDALTAALVSTGEHKEAEPSEPFCAHRNPSGAR
ncbi:hypothetical protein BBOMB_1066 [Bifidobacterium bombi DSM 19703]|uniref:Uncharacterized protein n=1 Tax=Bifidobacterium bombi DSM 19703 TaxID=1341695 RepID=A0A080N6J4_9BIFI|nr:hypothetical protein BBOMB_1066 [Bifidobacterium bombi DSM 19703]